MREKLNLFLKLHVKIKQHFPKMVWLNPEPETFWDHVTIASIRKAIKMYSLTLEGLTLAINDLRKGEGSLKPLNFLTKAEQAFITFRHPHEGG